MSATKKSRRSTGTLSARQKAKEALRIQNARVKQIVDAFFSTLSPEERAHRSRWSLAARHVNRHPDGLKGRDKEWSPQGLARACQMEELWQRRKASPGMVTAGRRKIYRIIAKLKDDGLRDAQIADILNRKGLYWRAKGKDPVPFTSKRVNDYFRHHKDLWPMRPRRGSKAQTSLEQLSIYDTVNEDLPKRKPGRRAAVVELPEEPKPPVARKPKKQSPSFVPESDDANVSIFKRSFGDTKIKLVLREADGTVDVVVRYSGRSSSDASSKVASLVQQLQEIDYRD